MFRAIRLWLLRRRIRRTEGELMFLRGIEPADRNHAAARELIPLVEAELRTLRARLNEFQSGR
jgi:hypothetical protein